MESLPETEPKMFGVLLVEDDDGRLGYLRAFSGRWNGAFRVDGWVPPIFEIPVTRLESETKERLAEIRRELEELSSTVVALESASADWERRILERRELMKQRKAERDRRRSVGACEGTLQEESRRDKRELKELKSQRESELEPLRGLAQRVLELKRARRELSRALQAEMHQSFSMGLWSDRPWSLASLFPDGPPTGIGECCAPKLLHYSQEQRLKPVAMAEIWWGDDSGGRRRGGFYPPCVERCEPLMGAFCSDARADFEPLYEDAHILAVDKPTGVLAVPGGKQWNQDSVLNRLKSRFGELWPVHRLDMATSGVLLVAKSAEAQGAFQRLFAERAVEKEYQALLSGVPTVAEGEIDLALGRDSSRPGCYRVDSEGKTAVTHFRVIESTRVLLRPVTGRSHQLRIHAASGLGVPIRGDRLYGTGEPERLKLHAWKIKMTHPFTGEPLQLKAEVPF